MRTELNVGNIVIVTAEHPDGSSANTHGDIGIITVKEKVTDEVDYTVHTACSDYMYGRDQLRLATQEEIENEFRRLLTR